MSEKSSDEPVAVETDPNKEKSTEPVIYIFPEWCKGCRICVAFCPKQVLVMGKDQKAHVAHEENCIRCYLCARRCPDLAITLRETDGQRKEDPDTGVSVEEEGDD
jgi:2-oxoglutarate ferredoxin oxidoreductase subunit delta